MTAGANGSQAEMDKRLHSEVRSLIQYITRLREEIAGIAREQDDQTAFDGMADRLDAIVDSTADATDSILTAMEGIDEAVEKLRAHPEPAEIDALCDKISEKSMAAMEACSFQDLTGQRINRVVGSLKFVEQRVNSMAEICGRDEILDLGKDMEGAPEQVDGGVVLDGPQRAEDAISQDEIDNLFS